MYSLVVLLATLVAYSHAISYQVLVQEQWEQFKLEHGKVYESESENEYRQSVFMENLFQINEHNKLYEMGLSSYQMAMNHLGDLTKDEFMRIYTVNMPQLPQSENLSDSEPWLDLPQDLQGFVTYALPTNLDEVDLPTDIDWRQKGAVTPVKNQRNCGSCWSFSATGALEAQWFKKTNKLISLSEQQLVDCSGRYGNHGCHGGWMHWAFGYIKENGGIDTEQSYPYTAKDGRCAYKPGNKAATVSQVIMVPRGENQLAAKVSSVGPISIAAEVSHKFQFYHSGVYDEPQCGHSLNHAMLAVGYGSMGGKNFWLVKNSWGTGWGDQGYIRMAKDKNNQCGIALMASYPGV
uniref:Cathepsin L 2 n=1 Tax=Diaprepes abbreviatus TaxID=13040 RepID=Q0PZI3_DIAAB|nr:cathepsin L 2 precursor [Diaprepes abbreviatus]